MSLQNFRIDFDRPGATYAPGETVTGEVTFHLSAPKNVKEIRLESCGMAKTSWSESSSTTDTDGNSQSSTDWYGTTERYLKTSNRLFGSETGDEQTTLPAGQYSYKFALPLPVKIPCSFEHSNGHVRYVVQVIIDRPWKLNHKVDSAFTVAAPYDSNTDQGRTTAIHDVIEREFHRWIVVSAGTMKVNVSSGASKFVPGGKFELIVNYDRSSTQVDITNIKLELVKKITFYSSLSKRSSKKYSSEVLGKVKDSGPFGKKGETSLTFLVPSVSPLNMQYCSIIDVDYQLVLSINISGMHRKLTRSYPVQL